MDSEKPRALLSVWDKTGIVEFATSLAALGFELVSTGGTARMLKDAGLQVMSVSDVTQHPEIFDGRVKTLHPAIHGPLLARMQKEEDRLGMTDLKYTPISLVACNLYPFVSAAAADPPLDKDALLEMIDIGGPTMVRASAKNHANVIICCDPNDYESIIEDLTQAKGEPSGVPVSRRQELALAAYQHTASYDVAIANTLHQRWNGVPESFDAVSEQSSRFHNTLLASAIKMDTLRYGENAHQSAALFVDDDAIGRHSTLVTAHVEGGKAMSYNNYSDADATLRLCRSLSTDEWPDTPHACVIVKHNNPCGVALAASQVDAYRDALASDPESAFGSIICFNEIVTLDTAQAMADLFIEVLIAPGYAEDAKEFIMKKGNRRLLTIDSPQNRLAPLDRKRILKQIEGGWIVQTEEAPIIDWSMAKTVTEKKVTREEIDSMKFAVRVCEQVKSNAIVMVQASLRLELVRVRQVVLRQCASQLDGPENVPMDVSLQVMPSSRLLMDWSKLLLLVLPRLCSLAVRFGIKKSLMQPIVSVFPCYLLATDCSGTERII